MHVGYLLEWRGLFVDENVCEGAMRNDFHSEKTSHFPLSYHSVPFLQTEESHPVVWKAEIAKKKRY